MKVLVPDKVVTPEDVAEEQRRDLMRNQEYAHQQRAHLIDLMERQRNRELFAWGLFLGACAYVLWKDYKRSAYYLRQAE